jgi:hypothetical protein
VRVKAKETGIDPKVWACVGGSREPVTWQLGHERLLGIRKRRARLDAEEALWLVVCEELGTHRQLGMGSLVEYVATVLGLDAHSAMERIRVARVLVRLPATFEKLFASELCWSAVRELSRVATPETEREWLGACTKLGVRDIERLVSGRRPGDLPSSPEDESARRHAVRFEVSGSTLALVRQAQDEHRRRTGQSLDDDVFVAELARAYLAGRKSSGAAAHVMMTVCPSCRRGTADAAGEAVALGPSEVERLACDARVVPGARVEAVVERKSHRGSDDPSHAGPELRSPVGPHDAIPGSATPSPGSMAELDRRSGLRVETELSKKVRELVLRRHHGRCAVPGCSNAMCLHVHHVEPRADGGTHDPELLLPLCDAHHRAVHDRKVRIDGTWSTRFTFRYADGTSYGAATLPDPRSVAKAKGAFSVLRNLGFKHREAEAAVDTIRDRVEPDMSMEEVARLALEATLKLPGMQRVSRVRETEAPYLPSWTV